MTFHIQTASMDEWRHMCADIDAKHIHDLAAIMAPHESAIRKIDAAWQAYRVAEKDNGKEACLADFCATDCYKALSLAAQTLHSVAVAEAKALWDARPVPHYVGVMG